MQKQVVKQRVIMNFELNDIEKEIQQTFRRFADVKVEGDQCR